MSKYKKASFVLLFILTFMLKLSKFPFKTLKTRPKVSDNKSTSILLQGGYIRQTMAGVYEFLPIGYKVLKNIENIVREEMNKAGYYEMLMSILSPRELWETTNRWEIPEYFKVPGWGNTEYRISPTNEENVTNIFKEFIQSYKDFPTCVYHIQKKFRNEKRAKSGLLRGREFLMKDAYSFHENIEDFDKFYEKVKKVYMNVYNRLGIGKDTIITVASGGAMSDKPSHEFQTFLEIGEDTIYVCDKCKVAYNAEIVGENFKCLNCGNKDLEVRKACEVGNIFYLGTKYSKPFGLSFSGENNKMVDKVEMGCYGIGISRLMGVIAEYFMTENGIAWPEEVAPYDYYIIVIGEENLEKAEKLGLEIELIKGKSVILDDRVNIGFGQRAGDCELFGILNRIVISSKTLEKGGYELKGRNKEELIVKF